MSRHDEEDGDVQSVDEAEQDAEALEDGSLDPDELAREPEWWDEGSDDEG